MFLILLVCFLSYTVSVKATGILNSVSASIAFDVTSKSQCGHSVLGNDTSAKGSSVLVVGHKSAQAQFAEADKSVHVPMSHRQKLTLYSSRFLKFQKNSLSNSRSNCIPVF